MGTTPPPFFTSVFLITLLLTGVISTLTSISFGDTEAFVDKKESKLNTEEEDKNNYQEKYKQYDFEKYLSNQYEIYKEYAQYYGNLLYIAENPQKNTFFTHGDVKEPDDNRQQKHSDRDDDDDDDDDNDDNDNHANGKSSFVESNNEQNDIVTKEKVIYTLDKSEEEEKEKKTYKNIKIIECSNLNLNNYDVQNYTDVEKILNAKEAKDWSVVQEILNKVTFSENNKHDDADDDVDENQVESHIKNSKEPQQYNIGSETKIIFICTNDNLNMEPTNADNNLIRSLPDEGIILPITAPTENNNNNNNNYEQFASKKEGKLAGFLAGKQEGELEQFEIEQNELANAEDEPQGKLAELTSKPQGKLAELANAEDEPQGKLAELASKQEGELEQFESKQNELANAEDEPQGKLAELANAEDEPQGKLAELASKQEGELEQFESKQNELANEEDEQEGKLERLASKLKELVQQ